MEYIAYGAAFVAFYLLFRRAHRFITHRRIVNRRLRELAMPETKPVKFVGRPITEDIQDIFGRFGKVEGILVRPDGIDVTYENGIATTFIPVTKN